MIEMPQHQNTQRILTPLAFVVIHKLVQGKLKHYHCFILHFDLHKAFAANFTINVLHLTNSLSNCSKAFFAVIENDDFKMFCGHHAATQVYSKYNECQIKLYVAILAVYFLSLDFSVSKKGHTTYLHSFPLKHVLSLLTNQFEKVSHTFFTITVNKYQHILFICENCLENQNIKITVHDGPGIRSRIIGLQQQQPASSSFLSFVEVYYTLSNIIFDETHLLSIIQFCAKQLPISSTIQIKETEQVITLVNSTKIPFHIFFFSNADTQINISVINISHRLIGESQIIKGYNINIYSCRYAGILSMEKLANYKEESLTLCARENIQRNFYSFNSSLSLLAYSFANYGTVNATCFVSGTRCRAIPFNTCCLKHENFAKVIYTKMVIPSNVFQSVFQINSGQGHNPIRYQFKISENMCIILRVNEKTLTTSDDELLVWTHTCGSVRHPLIQPLVLNSKLTVQYKVTGFVDNDPLSKNFPEHFVFKGEIQRQNFCYFVQGIKICVEDFHIQINTRTTMCEGNTWLCLLQRQTVGIERQADKFEWFVEYTHDPDQKLSSKATGKGFNLGLGLYTRSWFDIEIVVSENTTREENGLQVLYPLNIHNMVDCFFE